LIKGRRLHEAETPGVDEMFRLRRERTIEGNEIGLAKDRVQVEEGDFEFGGKRGVYIGIVRNEVHVERFGEAKDFRSDVADPD
jgi:hypothetical protein